MNNAIITGVSGQDESYLTKFLIKGYKVVKTVRKTNFKKYHIIYIQIQKKYMQKKLI